MSLQKGLEELLNSQTGVMIPKKQDKNPEAKAKKDGLAKICKKCIDYLSDIGLRKNSLTGAYFLNDLEIDMTKIKTILMDCRMKFTIRKDDFFSIIESEKIERFTSLDKFLLAANGKDPKGVIDSVFSTLELVDFEQTNYLRSIFKKFFVGFFAKILGHGHRDNNDILLVLCGDNNLGKTYFWNELFSVFSERQTLRTDVPKEDDLIRFAAGNYLCIFDDISNDFFKKSDAIKSILTNNQKGIIAKYSNFSSNQKLVSSFVATSNYTDIIFDSDYNRRIIPINIKKRNKDAFDANDKLEFFIEAYNLYLQGFDFKLSEAEIEFVKSDLNMQSKNSEFGSDLLLQYLEPSKPTEGGTYYLPSEILAMLPEKLCKSMKELGHLLAINGFSKKVGARRNGKQIGNAYCIKIKEVYYENNPYQND